jgi:hypothetical protein
VLVWYVYALEYGRIVEELWKVPGTGYFDVMTWIPNYSPIVLHMGALTSNYPSHLEMNHEFVNSYKTYASLYHLAPSLEMHL